MTAEDLCQRAALACDVGAAAAGVCGMMLGQVVMAWGLR